MSRLAALTFCLAVVFAGPQPTFAEETTVFEERWRSEGREIYGLRYQKEIA